MSTYYGIRNSSITNNRNSFTLGAELLKEERKRPIYKRLKDHTWGLGLEHEVHLFHRPYIKKNKHIEDFILFDSKPIVEKLLKDKRVSRKDKDFLSKIPFEPTGRKCNGKIVLKKTPVGMPEFITENPFSSLETGKRPIEYYCEELIDKENHFKVLLERIDKLKKLQAKYGEISQYPFGMTSYLKYSLTDSIPYKFEKSNGKDLLNIDYLGSYHITITLPFNKKTSEEKFIKMHQNFANQIQWLEPLLVTAFFSSDQKAVGTSQKRIKGSFRVARVGWGNFAGSDVTKFNKGIGRYSDIKTFWRNGLEFEDVKKAKYCEELSPRLKKLEPGAISGYSSNFRTFGSTDPNRPWHRESGIGMNVPNGIEMRIYDHFDSLYLFELGKFVIYVAENSRVHHATKYVYKNKGWIMALQKIMLEGWSAQLPIVYIKDLRSALGLKIATKSLVAYDVLKQINIELFKKNRKGDWTYLMLEKEYEEPVELPKINRESWELGLMIKMNRNEKLLEKFNEFIEDIPETSVKSLEDIFYEHFDKKLWESDYKCVVYFLEKLGLVKLSFSQNGSIRSIKLNKSARKKMGKIDNFNERIIEAWDKPKLKLALEILEQQFQNNS